MHAIFLSLTLLLPTMDVKGLLHLFFFACAFLLAPLSLLLIVPLSLSRLIYLISRWLYPGIGRIALRS
jgi:hypothetical protein